MMRNDRWAWGGAAVVRVSAMLCVVLFATAGFAAQLSISAVDNSDCRNSNSNNSGSFTSMPCDTSSGTFDSAYGVDTSHSISSNITVNAPGDDTMTVKVVAGAGVDDFDDGDEYIHGRIRMQLSFDVNADDTEFWQLDLDQSVLGLFKLAGDGDASAVGNQDDSSATINQNQDGAGNDFQVTVDGAEFDFAASPDSYSSDCSNSCTKSSEFSGSRSDTNVISGNGDAAFNATIEFDIEAFSNDGCSGFICSSASGGEEAAVLFGLNNVAPEMGTDNYGGRDIANDGYTSIWTFTVSECGDGNVDPQEECDDSNLVDCDGCDSDCKVSSTCGNGIQCANQGEECDDGNLVNNDGCSDACELECGNGVTGAGETCDDGNQINCDGCDIDCQPSSTCGNGVECANEGEQCDDGNLSTGDGCDDACLLECGNGVVEAGEQCDDNNFDSEDGCSDACVVETGWDCSGEPSVCTSTCGDEIVAVGAETCDDGNAVDCTDGCDSNCQLSITCGNGITCDPEECDDGNNSPGDGCSATCLSESTCGDALIEGIETCDDGDADTGDGCSDICQVENGWTCSEVPSICTRLCGNGAIDGGEQCDPGTGLGDDSCTGTCQFANVCGNGVIEFSIGESCDDGNTAVGDGCDNTCQLENCGDGVVDPAEECDDNNNDPGDGCSRECLSEPTVDHYVGYKVGTPTKNEAGIRIDNRLPKKWIFQMDDQEIIDNIGDDPRHFEAKNVRRLFVPATKNDEEGPSNSALHYIQYQVKKAVRDEPKHTKRSWEMLNQFGRVNIITQKERTILIPAAADLEDSPSAAVGDQTHYMCYQVKLNKQVITSDQAPQARFSKSLQAYLGDAMGDCDSPGGSTTDGGNASDKAAGLVPTFDGSGAQGMCLFDFKRIVEVCHPADKSAREEGVESSATITPSEASTTDSLLCYKAKTATKWREKDAGDITAFDRAAFGGGSVGQKIAPKQPKPYQRRAKNGNAVHVAPENGFQKPTILDKKQVDYVCLPSRVLEQKLFVK